MKKATLFLLLIATLCGCRVHSSALPGVSGKAGEVIVVIGKDDWEGKLGTDVRATLARNCPWLPTKEALYSLVNIAPGAFADLFKIHRNIVFFDIDPQTRETGVFARKDIWASPQCVIQISAPDSATADSLFKGESQNIVNAIEQAERDRVVHNSILYENYELAPVVKEVYGGSPHFPTGYKLKKKAENFIWIADERQYTIQGIFVYSYPAAGDSLDLNPRTILAHRDAALKDNVPGMFDGSYMITGRYPSPQTEYLKYRGRALAQTRGWWEVENDFMGGPFTSHAFYSRDGKNIIVAEAFVYAPKFDKRQYLRQVESILYSWEWNEEK
ncbi:MAG: DUF4837 family protein [Bacteroidales bacterium]|nr:DUF4837 family protein [Bacteroidales bacterium]